MRNYLSGSGQSKRSLRKYHSGSPLGWRRRRQATPIFLPGECHGQRSLEGCSPAITVSRGVARSRTRLSEYRSLSHSPLGRWFYDSVTELSVHLCHYLKVTLRRSQAVRQEMKDSYFFFFPLEKKCGQRLPFYCIWASEPTSREI